jgi:hypothetical protein
MRRSCLVAGVLRTRESLMSCLSEVMPPRSARDVTDYYPGLLPDLVG